MKNYNRIGGLLSFLKQPHYNTNLVNVQFPQEYIEFSKFRSDKKSDKNSNDIDDNLKGAIESYAEYLASQIYELQVRLLSKQDEVPNLFKTRDISN